MGPTISRPSTFRSASGALEASAVSVADEKELDRLADSRDYKWLRVKDEHRHGHGDDQRVQPTIFLPPS
jgi:hypothetical protein